MKASIIDRTSLFILSASVVTAPMILIPIVNRNPLSSQASPDTLPKFEEQQPLIISETGKSSASASRNWWLNSGGEFHVSNGAGKTLSGNLRAGSPWRLAYAKSNPTDTDNGYRPQNIFRLVTKRSWNDFEQEVYFKINATNISRSPNRNSSNGIFLFKRYKDGNNLYYTGVRVDGYAVIKKKQNGVYYTLAQEPVWQGERTYDRSTNPNLIPIARWIGIKSALRTDKDGNARIQLFVDHNRNGNWILYAEAEDISQFGPPIPNGRAGIRTDFMDAEFDDFRIDPIE